MMQGLEVPLAGSLLMAILEAVARLQIRVETVIESMSQAFDVAEQGEKRRRD
jgi:hypothetical protein